MPEQEPPWDLNTDGGKMLVKQYQQVILYGIKHRIRKPRNISKLYQVTQGPLNEETSVFYERRCEVARKQADLNPDAKAK